MKPLLCGQYDMEHLYTIVGGIAGSSAVHQVRAPTVGDAIDEWWRKFPIEKEFPDFSLTADDLAIARRHLSERVQPLPYPPYEGCWQAASDFGQDFRYLNWPLEKVPSGVRPPKIRGALSLLIVDTSPQSQTQKAA
jgi:hypothetical protein